MHSDPLIIKDKLLYGVYECTARNEFGEAKKIIHLQEGFVPPAINNVRQLSIYYKNGIYIVKELK